jgi:aminoglycoside phosphotransferase (APT) family kinase protein
MGGSHGAPLSIRISPASRRLRSIVGLPPLRDADTARKDIANWLAQKVGAPVEVSPFSGPAATGFSNETLIFDATWTDTTSGEVVTEGLVLRIEPSHYTLFLEADFEYQWRVMHALAEHTDIPLPDMKWFEPDPSILGSAFLVMGKVDGQAPADSPPYTSQGWLFDASPEQQRQLWLDGLDVMARLHNVDWQGLGLAFLDKQDRGHLGIEQHLDYYTDYLAWASGGRPQPVAELALTYLKEKRPADIAPGSEDIRLSWGDSRPGNMLWRDFRCVAVLDWEMVTLGHPAADLAWWLFLDRYSTDGVGMPQLPGIPSREESIAHYERASGIRVSHLVDYYEILAGFRFSVVMMRLATLLTEYGLNAPGSDMETNNPVTQQLANLLGVPQPSDAYWQTA